MVEITPKLSISRLLGAIIVGIFVAFFVFFGIALLIGLLNDAFGANVPISVQFTENVGSAILLVVLIIVFVAAFCWKVLTTPPVTPEFEIPETIDKF